MPVWLTELIQVSPWVGVATLLIHVGFKTIARITDKPLSIATVVSVLGGKERRQDAKKIVEILCRTQVDSTTTQPGASSGRRRRRGPPGG